MQDFIPEIIFIDKELINYPLSKKIITLFNKKSTIKIIQNKIPKENIKKINNIQNHSQNHPQNLYLTTNKGAFVKKCPGTNRFICCNYYVIDLIENCHLDCSYCFLKNYLKDNLIKIYLNTEKLFNELDSLLENKNAFFRIGTGELSDSLALDNITNFSTMLVKYFKNKNNAILELKTKTNNINQLTKLKHNNNIVVSWSLNPKNIIQNEENKCSTLNQRINAAKTLQKYGYKLAFHFDPIIYHTNWEQNYKELINTLFNKIKPQNITWISLGGLRFTKNTIDPFNEKQSHIFYEEFLESPDGKMRYFIKIRKELFAKLRTMIKEKNKDLFVYLCMEDRHMWKLIFNFAPKSNIKLDQMFKENIDKINAQ